MHDFDPDNPDTITGPAMAAPWARVYPDLPTCFHPTQKRYAVPIKSSVYAALAGTEAQALIDHEGRDYFVWAGEVKPLCANWHTVLLAYRIAQRTQRRARIVRRSRRPQGIPA